MKRFSVIMLMAMLASFIIPDDSCTNPLDPEPHDGPYVLYKNGKILVYSMMHKNNELKLKKNTYDSLDKERVRVMVPTDEKGKVFAVPLQKQLLSPAAEYPEPSRIFILSDIEGNFAAFRKLLQEGGVIDTSYNWTFDDGHLVLTGDFVDRGTQQTEVLWLIYSLEEKAKAAGGFVHYILGNHEIMNLSGDLRYLQPKYHASAELLETTYPALIGDNSEIGRWLRTKNVVEKIGDLLFTHGGISSEINVLNLDLEKVNALSRPYYADSTYHYADPRSETIFSDKGPFWYRGYYQNTNGHEPAMIDSTLTLYKVQHIATGHTIIADTISLLYNNRLFNTDVHHAKGHTEALLKENGHYYRVVKGEKKLLL